MQLKRAFRLALLLGTFGASSCSAFVVSPKRHGYRVRVSARPGQQSQGWDNDNYLEALSGGKDALSKANQEYYDQSDFQKQQMERLAAEVAPDVPKTAAEVAEEFRLTEELKKKIEAAHEEGPGGTRLKELLKIAQQATPARPRSMEPPMYVPPVPQTPLPPPPVNPNELSVEEQARMFREMMQRQAQGPPQQPPQYSAPYYETPARPSRPDPRPVGRNRDADAISNTSDLYLAQLKYDSSVRNIARYSGDDEKANAVFKDEGVQKLKEELLKNPYLTSAPQSMFGLSAEDALHTMMTIEGERAPAEQIDVTATGISYKEKLRQRQLEKQGQPSETKTESPTSNAKVTPTTTEASMMAPPAFMAPKASATVPEPEVATPPAYAAVPPPPQVATPPSKPQFVSATPPPPPSQVSTPPPAASATSASTDFDSLRGEIRTLMGLLLKHRGGPGFGAGRLKEPEVERFERLLSQLTGNLQKEAESMAGGATATASSPTPVSRQAPPQPQSVQPPAVASQPRPQPTVSTSSAISMAETVPGGERIQRMISCIEGAVQMYKNSPPELQEGLLIPVRSALMTAVTTCNQVIAENELRNYEAYKSLAGSASSVRAAPPSQYFDVDQVQGDDEYDVEDQVISSEYGEDVDVRAQSSAVTELDGNSKILEKIYQDLKAAAGDGKLGLRPNLTAEEASNLSASLLDMRAILMEELDTGIPVAQQSPIATSTVSSDQGSSANSKYQQLLAKARASKAQN